MKNEEHEKSTVYGCWDSRRWSPGLQYGRTGDETLALSASSVSANKRGMTYEGGDVTFDVLSNVYWVINLDEDADWLTVAPRAAYGNQTVKVTAAVNPGGRRSTTLRS